MNFMKKKIDLSKVNKLVVGVVLAALCIGVAGCGAGQRLPYYEWENSPENTYVAATEKISEQPTSSLMATETPKATEAPAATEAPDNWQEEIPSYEGIPYAVLNKNIPQFTTAQMALTEPFENYSELDALGRCGEAFANVCVEIMPEDDRESIGQVKPAGWHLVKYDFIDGKYLYNRCHLIGFQLAGENANEKNLITGTRYLNVKGMLPFENEVADYVKATGNHVLYRATPVYTGENLIADGVQIEAYSVEDSGKGICFNIFCYNVQPGVVIDYLTGESKEAAPDKGDNDNDNDASEANVEAKYILNLNSKRFHRPDCGSVEKIAKENYMEYTGTYEDLIELGYKPCGTCDP